MFPQTLIDRFGQPYLVREAVADDGPIMVALLDSVGQEEIYIADERAQLNPEQESRLIGQRNSDLQCILVVEQDGQIAGSLEMIRGAMRKNRHTAIFGMALFAAFRGRGIGRGLLSSAEGWAVSVGVAKVCLSVFATNDRALALYRSLGYEEEGRRYRQYYIQGNWVDEVWMAHWISPGPP